MIVTTTQTVENRSIDEYVGLVAGQSIWEENKAKEIITGIATAPSHEAAAGFKDQMTQARLAAIAEMKTKAEKMGADAIVAIAFDHLVIHNMLMLFSSGTAVKLAEPPLSM